MFHRLNDVSRTVSPIRSLCDKIVFVQKLTIARTTNASMAENVSVYWATTTANALITLMEHTVNGVRIY